MPDPQTSKYRIELEDGKTFEVEVEGTEPPTEAEIHAYMQAHPQPTKTGDLKPHTPGLVESGLDALSNMGPVPAMVSGAIRDTVGPISNLVQSALPASPSVPGLKEALDYGVGRIAPAATPDEELGSGLSTAIGVGTLPSAAPGIAEAQRLATQGAGRLLKSRLGTMILPNSQEPGVMATLGRFRNEIGDWLMGPNAGGRLASQTVDDGVREALDALTSEGGRYTQVPPSSPAGGGYTIPPEGAVAAAETRAANPGMRLVSSRTPTAEVNDSIQSALESLANPRPTSRELPLSHPVGGEATIPPPADLAAAIQTAVPSSPRDALGILTRETSKATSGTGSRLRQLSQKAVLTPEEANELAFLTRLAEQQAREAGMSYAARGKAR